MLRAAAHRNRNVKGKLVQEGSLFSAEIIGVLISIMVIGDTRLADVRRLHWPTLSVSGK